MNKHKIKILQAAPRGFCAGVDRAIEIVKKSIDKFGAPVYVRHEIVHNKHVVESLKKIGAIFVEELEEKFLGYQNGAQIHRKDFLLTACLLLSLM